MSKIVTDSIITFVTRILVLLLSISFNVIISRILGPSLKGSYSIITMIFGTSVLLFLFGLGSANVYFGSKKNEDIPILAGNSLVLGFLFGFVGVIAVELLTLLPAFYEYLQKNNVDILHMRLTLLMLPIGLLIAYLKEIIRASGKILHYSIVNLLEFSVALVLIIILYFIYKVELYESVFVFIFAKFVTLIFVFYTIIRLVRFKLKYDFKKIQQTLSFGIRLYPGGLAQFLNSRLDIFFIGYFLSPISVGLYITAVLLSERLLEIPNSIRTVLLHHIASSENESETKIITTKLCRIIFFVTGVICGLMGFISSFIISVLFGNEYVAAAPALMWLLPGVWFLSVGKLLAIHILGSGYPHIPTIGAIISLLMTILFDVLLIPRLGIVGASIATSIAYFTTTLVYVLFFLRTNNVSVKEVFLINQSDISTIKTYIGRLKFKYIYCKLNKM